MLPAFLLVLALALVCPAAVPQSEKTPQNPAQIELLETKVRFETNGDSRKEVHALVKINNELGVRQFARLNFDFNRSFQSVEIPLASITHAKGGTSEILPSAITDNPNPAVVNFPAYQDVRVKSIRILGLAPGDTLEYRVITITTHPPLAPDFWLDHTFDRTGVVSREIFEVQVPSRDLPQTKFNPTSKPRIDESPTSRVYRWEDARPQRNEEKELSLPDVELTTFKSWSDLAQRLGRGYLDFEPPNDVVASEAQRLTTGKSTALEQLEGLYTFVAQRLRTVDLPVGATEFRLRPLEDVISSAYATPEDKAHLLVALISAAGLRPAVGFTSEWPDPKGQMPSPSALSRVLANVWWDSKDKVRQPVWFDAALEVAPFGLVRSDQRGRPALYALARPRPKDDCVVFPVWEEVSPEIPFRSSQVVSISAAVNAEGSLSANVKYKMRGDNELVLRLAFHQAPKEKWNEVAQLLALSDGFRGKVTSVTASDPYATRDPFTVEYEVVQPKFVDWTKTPVRIPAILPLLGLPDPPAEPGKTPIELGTPLDVHTSVTLHLPPGTSVEAPAGTNVERDYATFSSQYASANGAITASRHIHFIERQIPADRAADYNAFLHAVQSDQAQRFTLFPPQSDSAKAAGSSKKD